jgi:lipopolysaccharide export system protein LptA
MGLVIDGEAARRLVGNVKFHQGKIVVSCREAIHYKERNKIVAKGEAEFWDGTMRMVADSGAYYGNTKTLEAFNRVMLEESTTTLKASYGKYYADEKKAFFSKNVSVEDTSSLLTCNELTYFREEQKTIAIGDVKITDHRNGVTISGNHFENYRKKRFSRMTEHPLLFQVDTAGEGKHDTLIVRSSTMEAYQDTVERFIARDSVTITRAGLAAEAGLSVFYTVLDSMTLAKSPMIWYSSGTYDDNQVSGDSIFIKLRNRKLETVYVLGDAFAISRAESTYANRFNQMTGQEIVMRFEEGKIRGIDVDKTATSLYYLFDKQRGDGINKTTGDHVSIFFRDGKVDGIKVIGGAEGQYFPEKMIVDKESDYNLTGFIWKERRKSVAQ